MLSFLTSTLQSLTAHPTLVYGFLFLDALLTTFPVLGTVILETPVAVLAGALAAQGHFSFLLAMVSATIGGIIGDALGYYLGRWLGMEVLSHHWLITRRQWDRAHVFFERHGGKSIIIARFIGPVRTVMPLVAGLSTMSPRSFWVYNIASAIIWTAVFYPLGYFFGAQWRTIVAWAERGGWAALLIILLGLAYAWMRHRSTLISPKNKI